MSEGAVENNGLSPDEMTEIALITQLRLYDTLMALLTHLDEDKAQDLLNLHGQGHLMAPSPKLSGRFVYDEVSQSDNVPPEPKSSE